MGVQDIPFPTGQTNAQLYNWGVNTAQTLRRILQQVTGGEDVDLASLASDVSDLQDQTASLQSQIDSLVANGDLTPQQAFELSLSTRADEILGSYSQLRSRQQTQMEQNADAVMQAAIQAAKANTGVRTTVRVMNEQNLALAERIDEVEADLGVTDANVVQLTQAVADGDSALATQITGVSSQVAGNTASIQVLTSSVNGVLTRFAVTVNSQGEVTGFIQLDGSVQGSSFLVNVDSFRVGKAGTSGGNALPPFGIDVVNGVAKMALKGDFIADGAISARTVEAGAITADKISANNLAAIAADLGTVIAGVIRDAANRYRIEIANGLFTNTAGTSYLDLVNNRLLMTPDP